MKSLFVAVLIGLYSICPYLKTTEPNFNIYSKAEHAWIIEHKHNKDLKPIITIVDFTLPSYVKRLWIINIKTHKILYRGYVAHGIGSGDGSWVKKVSNKPDSKTSSVGVYITLHTYTGHAGLSLYLKGLEKGYNDNIYNRHIVVHGANYVNDENVGHSWGCLAVERGDVKYITDIIKNDSLVFVYFPDSSWLSHSRYLNG